MENQNIPKTDKRLETLAIETEKKKKELVVQLRKTPIVEHACGRTGIGRSTYYKWRANDRIFARAADSAVEAGRFFINDMAESQLLRMIQGGNLTATIFWLKNNHPKYSTRVIHEYDLTCKKESTEDRHAALHMVADLWAQKFPMPEVTAEQTRMKIEEEDREAAKDRATDEALERYNED